ncbi:MAG: hypothetical protein E6700_08930 [Winkia neuii]|nr:hypothetical protein [Winkia neuii]OFJ70972.1 hypothetical protein HMPREF2851_08735 [Actinomyces sp. HMSC064C12]
MRTLAASSAAFHPLSYHCGSVWAHDNGMIIEGMLAEGFTGHAHEVALRLDKAAAHFGYRMPELFAVFPSRGEPADEGGRPFRAELPPVPYPASCRPQAWAAATAFVCARALR